MNLGDIYIETFLVLVFGPILISCAAASLVRIRRRVSWTDVLWIGCIVGCFAAFVAVMSLHRPLFVRWHRAQNDALPATGCLTYEPEFFRLFATYRMTRPEFDAWVADHPWGLKPGDNGLLFHDGPELGLTEPEASFESEPAPNGRQLRVYFKSGIMYVSYNVM